MEVKIKHNEELVDATIEMVDGVMVVSPKEVKLDVSKFTTGDILVCGWKTSEKAYEWICILDGRVEEQSHIQFFLEDFCGMYTKGYNGDKEIWLDHSFSDSATYIRYATEAEKKLLFDRLAEKGYEWNAERKELVKLKWKPKFGDYVFIVTASINSENIFTTGQAVFCSSLEDAYKHNRVFKAEIECKMYCDVLNDAINKAINQVKP